MKVLKWIKWIFSFFILIGALTGIIWGTIYILNNNGIEKEEIKKSKKTIEKVTSNENQSNLSEIYNIYLNNEKHKLKLEYQLMTKVDETFGLELFVYFDGKNVLEREVFIPENIIDIHTVFLIDEISSNIKINESNFRIINENDKEFLLIQVGMMIGSTKKYFYIIDNNGDLKNDNGILISDSSKEYLMENNELFVNYYNYEEKTLAKLDNNDIYALEEKTGKKGLDLIEYKYYLKEGKLVKDKIQIYENIKLNVIDNSGKE